MPTLTAAEESTLQSQIINSAQVDWYMALAPYGDPCFTAQINNGAATWGDRTIIYDNDVGEANVVAGQTLWIGTTPRSYDIGKVRIRSINAGANTIVVAENDHIAWADDLYLTCPGAYGFHELWGIYSRLVEAGFVVTFYEDYDLVYNDPVDDVIPPKANAGPPAPAFLNDDGYVDISFVGDRSYTPEVGAALATYTWNFADGVVQSGGVAQMGTCANPNVVRFTTTGFRYITLTVTDNTAQNRVGIVYVPVWVFDDDEPPLGVEMVSQEASPNWATKFKVLATNVDRVYNFPDGALCVIFTRVTYPDGSADIGGFCHRSEVHFVGWLDAETLNWSIDGGTVEFSVIDHCKRLDQLPGFAYTLEDDDTPSDWYEVNDLNFDRAAHIHFERRCTINQIAHVEPLGEGNARVISVQPYPDASIYTQIQEHLAADAMASVLCDRQGIVRITRDPQFMNAVGRNAVAVVTTLDEATIFGPLDQYRDHQTQLGYVRIGGWSYETPLLSEAPGVAPMQSENADHFEGFIIQDQTELNLWAGCWLCKANAPYKRVPIELKGYWPVFDPAFQEYVRISTTDPLGRSPFASDRFIVRSVEFKAMPEDGTEVTILTVEMEAPLCNALTTTIESVPPPESPPSPPPIIIITIPTPEVALVHDRDQVYATGDFDALNPTWNNITGALAGFIIAAEVDHFDGVGAWALTGTSGTDANDTGAGVGLWRTNDVTVGAPVWNLVFTQAQGQANRWTYPVGGCDGLTAQPAWGQLRSINPIAAGECLVFEARWHGLGSTIVEATMIYRVDGVGGFAEANDEVTVSPAFFGQGWTYGCHNCSPNAPANAGVQIFSVGMYVNQSDKRGCHQAYVDDYGTICPAGIYHKYEYDQFCTDPPSCVCAVGCKQYRPWPEQPGLACIQGLDGSTHVVFHQGHFYAQSQLALLGTAGAVYSTGAGEIDDDLWSSYAFCNICSHYAYYYYCKQINAVVARANELYRNGVATGVTSDLLFGGNGAGYAAGVIGHIRAIWDDDQTVVLVRKDEPDVLQPDSHVIWIWDPTNGLQDKTGNLSGVSWRGTGGQVAPAAWNHRFDNVGFSAFGVPLR